MKKVFLLLVILASLLASCIFPGKVQNNKKQDTVGDNIQIGLEVGNKAPDFTLKNLDGKDAKLSDYKNKIVILNFFGVWCPWCKLEMPGFAKVYNEYKDKDVELLVVDVGDTKTKLQDYLREEKININPVMDSDNSVSELYRVNGYPTTYMLDKEGIIRKVQSGYMEEKVLKDILTEIIGK